MAGPRADGPIDPGYLVGGPEHRAIVLVEHDVGWPAQFERERARITAALGRTARDVQHVGSTAVPGLAAKPVVDVLVTVDDVEDEARYVPQLVAAGYVLRVREPGHRMLRTPDLGVHVHVWPRGSAAAQAVLDLRDRLRDDPTDRELYGRTKRDLAARDWPTMNHYAEAKTGVIEQILARAAGARRSPG